MPSKARKALDQNLADVDRLLELHAEQAGDGPGRKYGLEVLNKAAIVLITACWEAYCEDLAEEGLEHILSHSDASDKIPEEIKKLVVRDIKDSKKNPHELAIWQLADDGWKVFLRTRLGSYREARNRNLNTPKSNQIDELFKEALGLSDISQGWKWAKKMPPTKARAKLDKFVELRGAIAHRGKAEASVTKAQVQTYLDFVKRAAVATGKAVNTHVRKITGKPLYKTSQLKLKLRLKK